MKKRSVSICNDFASHKQEQLGSPLFCHDHERILDGNDETLGEEIYGLVGIAFETYGTGSQTVTRFINIQSHRKWIETVKWSIPGKKKNIFTLWSRSEEDDPNDRELELDSNTGIWNRNSAATAMIWVDLIFTLLYCLELNW